MSFERAVPKGAFICLNPYYNGKYSMSPCKSEQ